MNFLKEKNKIYFSKHSWNQIEVNAKNKLLESLLGG